MVEFVETSIAGDVSYRNCHSYGAHFCSHVWCTLDMVPFQLLTYQLWPPPYAQGGGESVNTYYPKLYFTLINHVKLNLF